MIRLRDRLAACFVLLCLLSARGAAQGVTGLPPHGSFSGGPFDTVNNANLNVHFQIPIFAKAGSGMPFSYALSYDSSVWYPSGGNWVFQPNWGWGAITQAAIGYVNYLPYGPYYCYNAQHQQEVYYTFDGFEYFDAMGTGHSFNIGPIFSPASQSCNNGNGIGPTQQTGQTTDGSGYAMTAYAQTASASISAISTRSGASITAPVLTGTGSGTVTDTNGNTITVTYGGGTTTFTDTLNSTALTVTPISTTETDYTYTGGSGSVTIKVMYTQETIETNFPCSQVTNYGRATQETAYLITSVEVPNGTYTIAYEATQNPNHAGAVTGRLASVKLPTGGTISYGYADDTTNNITCSDGSPATLNRFVTTDSSNPWKYVHTESNNSWTTTLTDPNVSFTTTYNFLGIYEIERQTVPTGGSALATVYTCYNGTMPSPSNPCNLTTVTTPITEVTSITELPVTSSTNVFSETDTQYNTQNGVSYATYGLPTDIYQYAYSNSSPPTTKLQHTNCLQPDA